MFLSTLYIIIVTFAPAKFEAATSNSLEEMLLQENTLFDLDIGVKVTQNVAQYPPHQVTYAPVKFVVATSNSLGGDAFTRKYFYDLDPKKRCPVPSTSCDLCTCKV